MRNMFITWILILLTTAAIAQEFDHRGSRITPDHGEASNSLYYPCGIPFQDLGEQAVTEARAWLAGILADQPTGVVLAMTWFNQSLQVTPIDENLVIVTGKIPATIDEIPVYAPFTDLKPVVAGGQIAVAVLVSLENDGQMFRVSGRMATINNGI